MVVSIKFLLKVSVDKSALVRNSCEQYALETICGFFFKRPHPIKNQSFFYLWIHGEITISPDIAARLRRHSIVQAIAKQINI